MGREENQERLENQYATVYRLEEKARDAFGVLADGLAAMAEEIRDAEYQWEPGLSVQQAAKRTSGYNGLEDVRDRNDTIHIIVSDLFDAVAAANAANEEMLAMEAEEKAEKEAQA